MATIIVALILLAVIALVVGLLMYIHNRDQKTDTAKSAGRPGK